MIAIFGMAGLALDYSRLQRVRVKMASALDSAIIATAVEINTNNLTEDEAKAHLEDFLYANLGEYAEEYGIELQVLDIDWSSEEIMATVKTDLPLTLLKVAGWETAPIKIRGGARFGATETEVAMTFDVTGSMEGSKIADLKTAALSGVSELLEVNKHRPVLRISVVPYAEAVNGGVFSEWAYADKTKYEYREDDCLTERPGSFRFTDDGPENGPPFRDSRLDKCPNVVVQPLTSDRNLLKNAINSLTAGGRTAGHIGIQWAWYTISPNWDAVFTGDSVPAEYSSGTNKFAVLMTDGQFNTAYDGVSSWENVYRQDARSMQYALKLCENMKKKGIQIFTIGFALKEKDAIDTMAQCASPNTSNVKYFYMAANSSELEAVYSKIAEVIRMVRLSR